MQSAQSLGVGGFGTRTVAAFFVASAAGISPASGFFGPLTRAYIAAHP